MGASTFARIVAFIIDAIIWAVCWSFTGLLFQSSFLHWLGRQACVVNYKGSVPRIEGIVGISKVIWWLSCFVNLLLWTWRLARKGQTIGKSLLGLTVVKNGVPVGRMMMLLRIIIQHFLFTLDAAMIFLFGETATNMITNTSVVKILYDNIWFKRHWNTTMFSTLYCYSLINGLLVN